MLEIYFLKLNSFNFPPGQLKVQLVLLPSGQLKVQLVLSAMQHISDYTCVRFAERLNNETDYLNITSEKG